MRKFTLGLASAMLALTSLAAFAAEVKSGLQVGEKTGAFQVIDANGARKGQQHCYV